MAGPWFAVHRSGDDWQDLGQVWISNGQQDCQGSIQIRVELEEPDTSYAMRGTGFEMRDPKTSISQPESRIAHQAARARTD